MKKKNQFERNTEGWAPDAKSGEEAVAEDRSLDIEESGQFAPGGYYNQQTVINQGIAPLRKTTTTTMCRQVARNQDKGGTSWITR